MLVRLELPVTAALTVNIGMSPDRHYPVRGDSAEEEPGQRFDHAESERDGRRQDPAPEGVDAA